MQSLKSAERAIKRAIDATIDELFEYECDAPCSPVLYDATVRHLEVLKALRDLCKAAQAHHTAVSTLAVRENRAPFRYSDHADLI